MPSPSRSRITPTTVWVAVSLGAGAALHPLFSAETGTVEYYPLPEASRPLDDAGSNGAKTSVATQVQIGFDSRAVDIVRVLPADTALGIDSTVLWTAHYDELSDYLDDLKAQRRQEAMHRAWTGQTSTRDSAGSNPLRFELPVRIPEWARKLGMAKPSLTLSGSYTLKLSATSQWSNAEDDAGSRIPEFSPTQIPNITLNGKVGRLVSVSLNWNEDGFGTSSSQMLQVKYAGEKPEDTEDDILQEAEFGQIALSLSGSTLTGYTEAATGLIGLRAKMKFGDLDLTVVGGAEQGERKRQSLGRGATTTTETFKDIGIESLPKDFFLDSAYYRANWSTGVTGISAPTGLRVFQRVTAAQKKAHSDWAPFYTGQAIPWDGDGNKLASYATPDGELWRELTSGTDWYWNNGVLRLTTTGTSTDLAVGVIYRHPVSQTYRGTESSGEVELQLLRDKSRTIPALTHLVLRNRYYKLPVVASSEQENVTLRILDGFATGTSQTIDTTTNQEWAKVFGLIDSSTGKLKYDDPTIFDWDKGVLTFPDLEPFAAYGRDALYDSSQAAINNAKVTSRFTVEVTAKGKSDKIQVATDGSSTSSSNCFDIQEGSEVLTLNGSTKLERGVDYEVNYTSGTIYLTSDRARSPSADIQVEFACTPWFSLESRTVAGARLEYKIPGVGTQSVVGATGLYRSETVTDDRPQLGREPNTAWLWGANLHLEDESDFLTELVDRIPFVAASKASTWSFDLEGAQSWNQPNTGGEAVVDDFESADEETGLPLGRTSWYQASPPEGLITDRDGDEFPSNSWQRKAEFVWSSNSQIAMEQIYPNYDDGSDATTEQTLLQLHLTQTSYSSGGKSWGGIMRPFSSATSDNSSAKYLEVVVRGSGGVLLFDFGDVSEDLSVAGRAPNEVLDGEDVDSTGSSTGEVIHDLGLDALADTSETALVWDCYGTSCSSQEVSRDSNSLSDPTGDDYIADHESSDPEASVNGTEGNNRSMDGGTGTYYDTEDLNRNGTLDVTNDFARFAIRLGGSGATEYTSLKNGWRRYRIPLDQPLWTSGNGPDWSDLGAVRVVYTGMSSLNGANQLEERALIARMALVGSEWEGTERLAANDVPTVSEPTVTNGVIVADTVYTQDSGRITVDVVSKQGDAGEYVSWDVPDSDNSGSADDEQSLRIWYKDLRHDFGAVLDLDSTRTVLADSGALVRSYATSSGDGKDLTLYRKLVLEVYHAASAGAAAVGEEPVRLGVQWGSGDYSDPVNYYEYSMNLYPAECPLGDDSTCALSDKERRASMVESWQKNQIILPLKSLAHLKTERTLEGIADDSIYRRAATADERPVLASESRDDSLVINGSPSLSDVRWMRLWIRANPDLPAGAPSRLTGQIWVNDLRVEDPRSGFGSALRSSGQVSFSDLLDVSGAAEYREGDFVEMGSTLSALSSQKSTASTSATATLSAGKFLPESWKASVPITATASGSIQRPWAVPGGDEELTRDGLSEILSDWWNDDLRRDAQDVTDGNSRGWQTMSGTRSLSASWSRSRNEAKGFGAFLENALLARPKVAWTYNEKGSLAPARHDSSWVQGLQVDYDFSPASTPSFHPFAWTKSAWTPSFLQDMEVQPWPSSVTTTLADLDYTETSVTLLDAYRDTALIVDTTTGSRNTFTRTASLRHALAAQWRLIDWMQFSGSLSSNRSWSDIDEAGKFDPAHFWEARDLVFAMDTTRIRNDRGDSVRQDFGFLRNENVRNVSWQVQFSPRILPFVTTSAAWQTAAASTRQAVQRVIDRSTGTADTTWQPFWTHTRTESFSASARLQSTGFFRGLKPVLPDGWGRDLDAADKALGRWRWSGVGVEYSLQSDISGLRQTLDHASGEGLDASSLWLWQLGLGDQFGVRDPLDIVTGRHDKTGWGQFQPWRLDDAAYYRIFSSGRGWGDGDTIGADRSSQAVSRTYRVSTSTGVTVPDLQLTLTPSLAYQVAWVESFDEPWSVDTARTWPQIGLSASLANFASKVGFLSKRFESVTASHATSWELRDELHPHDQESDTRNLTLKFSPFLGLTMKTKGAWTLGNKFNWSRTDVVNYVKDPLEADETTGRSEGVCPEDMGLPAFYSDESIDLDRCFQVVDTTTNTTWEVGDEFTASYRIQTKRGVQILRWFVKLDNDLTVSLTAGANRTWKEKREEGESGYSTTRPSENTKVYAGSNANYNFTPKLSATFDARFQRTDARVSSTSTSTVTYLVTASAQLQYRF